MVFVGFPPFIFIYLFSSYSGIFKYSSISLNLNPPKPISGRIIPDLIGLRVDFVGINISRIGIFIFMFICYININMNVMLTIWFILGFRFGLDNSGYLFQ